MPECGNDMAGGLCPGMAVDEHDARRGDIEPQAQQRRAQEHGREGRKLECPPHVDHRQQNHQRQRDIEGKKDVQEECRQRQHHHGEHHHHQQRHSQTVAGEFADRGYGAARAHASRYSSPTLGLGLTTRAATVGFSVRTRKMYESTCATATYSPFGISLFRSVERYSARAKRGASNTGTRCSSAMRRMLCATRSMPFANTTGARIFFGSYFSATAKCVGLTITTSATGTLCIMRRRARVCCICRMRCFVSGRPSNSLDSSRSSCRVMRSWRLNWNICSGTSTTATNASEPHNHTNAELNNTAPRDTAARGSMCPSASTSPKIQLTIPAQTAPTTKHLSRAFASSVTPCSPNRRFSPERGLKREKSGVSACVLKFQPPNTTDASSTMTMSVPNTGRIA